MFISFPGLLICLTAILKLVCLPSTWSISMLCLLELGQTMSAALLAPVAEPLTANQVVGPDASSCDGCFVSEILLETALLVCHTIRQPGSFSYIRISIGCPFGAEAIMHAAYARHPRHVDSNVCVQAVPLLLTYAAIYTTIIIHNGRVLHLPHSSSSKLWTTA